MDEYFLYAEDADGHGEKMIEKVRSVYFRQIRVFRVRVFTARPEKTRGYRGVSS